MADTDFPNDLIALERSAWQAIQAGTLTVDTALAVQQAVTTFAAETKQSRIDVEMALKKKVRHPEPEAA
ncbi:hypothetical protein [Streptomyces sp. NPDC058066]|uniref:hypothetical protein n=1 Tax=Streptomyces sp. NPDC058066 TaxID=3346323 RepID=UPI0036E3FC28